VNVYRFSDTTEELVPCFKDMLVQVMQHTPHYPACGLSLRFLHKSGASIALDGRGVRVRVPVGVKNFILSTSFQPALGPTQPPIQWAPGAISPRVNRPGREADHSPPNSADVKNTWIYTSTPPYAFMA
jgi:hypothetical protein